jgi:hypothetical protein
MARREVGQNADGKDEILDAEFERIAVTPTAEKDDAAAAAFVVGDRTKSSKSWLEWSLEADPDLNATRIPFFDPRSNFVDDDEGDGTDSIDVRLAFLVELDGETYGIGAPFDHAVALTVETIKGGSGGQLDGLSASPAHGVEYLPPTPDNEELMEIMASQLHDSVSPSLRLVRTPRVLTVRGPLDEYTRNWSTDVFPRPLTAAQLLDETDEDVEEFLKFMRKELGDAEYEDAFRGDSLTEEDKALLALFDIPGLGDQRDDADGIQEMFQSMIDPPAVQQERLKELQPQALDSKNVALKLVSYILPDSGKIYSLVSLLEPYVLVGKRVSIGPDEAGGEPMVRFELLSSAEEKILIPRLEQVCHADLEKAGLHLHAVQQQQQPPPPPPSLEP